MSATTIGIIIAVLFVLYILAKLVSGGGRVTDYFQNAVKVYLWLEDESAGYAAVAAAKTAASVQRDVMVSHLIKQSSQLKQFISEIPEFRIYINRLEDLAQKISAKDWSIQDAKAAKNELNEINPKYLEALNKSNPNIFISKYPALFQANNILELVGAAEAIKRSELEKGAEVMEQIKGLKEFQDPEVQMILKQGIEQAKGDLNK